jgi:hypothetical protein
LPARGRNLAPLIALLRRFNEVCVAADFPLGMAPARFVEPLEQPCESIHLRIPVIFDARFDTA